MLDSGNRSNSGLVGRSPWTARDALVPLHKRTQELRCGRGVRPHKRLPTALTFNLSQAHTH
ncbi:hypothetical protein SBA4_7240001 [Candidatus Sulfopaludibacter sp. SbA4]|nr:hypothetical protein SBA4_7240001 [Candidatus Sulfopaludibacter sp. SbA4]